LCNETNTPVIGLSHTGHLFHEKLSSWKPADVITQINHKIKYIEENIFHDENIEIILIGHSIGCYVILEMLNLIREDYRGQIKHAFLLFPTIERMNITPNGKILTFFTNFFMWFIYFVAFLVSKLPYSMQNFLIKMFFLNSHQQTDLIDNAKDVVHKMSTTFHCSRSCFHMGRDEMGVVKKLNKSVIESNADKILLYYGTRDRWCPLSFYDDMRAFKDELAENQNSIPRVLLDDHGLEHGFVIYKNQCNKIVDLMKYWIKP